MATEGQHIAGKIEHNVRHLIDELRGVPDEALNQQIEIEPSNTLYQLGFHTLGSARYWAITLAGGRNFYRDRSSEFVSSGSGTSLIAALDELIGQIHQVLDPLDSPELERMTTIASRHWSIVPDHQGLPLRDSLLHALEHTALHLGHAQITRQLLGYPPVRTD